MPGRILVNRLRELLTQQAAIQKAELDLRVEIQIVERQLQLLTVGGGVSIVPVDETAAFIEQNRDKLEPSDIEFLDQEWRPTKDVTDHTGIPARTLRLYCKDGRIEAKQVEGHWRCKTISVIRYMIREPDEK